MKPPVLQLGNMQIRLNGESRDLSGECTVAGLLAALKLDLRTVAVELNLAIVPRSHYAGTPLAEGDAVEIVRFIGGG
jgi:thiamine biosynthesis protein ThiS